MDNPPALPPRVAWFAPSLKLALWLLFTGLLFALMHGVLDFTNPNGLGTKEIIGGVVLIVVVYFALIFSPTWAGGRIMLDSQPTVGWITLTTLWGAAFGFALVDLLDLLDGYHWSDPSRMPEAFTASSLGAIVGAWLGLIFEKRLAAVPGSRDRLLCGFAYLVAAAVAYLILLRPALQTASK